MASTSSFPRSSSLHPPPKSKKRPVSMSSIATPYFVYCPIKLIFSGPLSTYAELESPPPSPLQRSTFDTYSDHSHDHKQPQQQQQQQQLSNHGRRRFNESRPIQIPKDLLCKSRSSGTFPIKRSYSSSSMARAIPPVPLKKKYTHLNTPLADKPATSPSIVRTLSHSKRISSLLFRKQQPSPSTPSVSIHPADHRSNPVNTRLGDFDEFEEVPIDSCPATPPPTTTTTVDISTASVAAAVMINHAALQKKMNMSIDDIDEHMNHVNRSPPLTDQTSVAIGRTSQRQAPSKITAMVINTNHSKGNFTNSIRSQSSADIIATSFKVLTSPRRNNTSNQVQDPSAPKQKKTLLESMSSSMRQVRKRAANLFGGIRQKRKKSKNSTLDQDEVDEGSLVTKIENCHLGDEDYGMSTLPLALSVAPFIAVPTPTSLARVDSSVPQPASWPMDVDVISISSSSSESFENTASPLTAAVAADLLRLSWSSPNGPSLFTRSAEDLTRPHTSSFYDFSGCEPSLPGDSRQALAAETETGLLHNGRCLSHSESAALVMAPKRSTSLSSIPFARHLRLYYGLADVDTNDDGVKQKDEQTNKSVRFGGLGYREWILSKNHAPSFMAKYKSGGKKDKDKGCPDANGFTLGTVGGNRSDPFRDRDVDELVELIFVDTPAPKSSSTPKKNGKNTTTKHGISIPSFSSPSSNTSSTTSLSSLSPICEQQQQEQEQEQEQEQQTQQAPQTKAIRRASLMPDTFLRQ
ncbi:hypothetical protein BG015_011232 [Linnemannia schmuckeri]|uniref:Uncharacterized protein n=1 Tax=Linnemannia schmuckeri TaxID=64567 RepID=A0A9P5RT02_9FUNG|nr:hypothetical protein BG015_011232 [Linnemannia schmuckeri]